MKLIRNEEPTIIFKTKTNESLMNSIRKYFLRVPILAIDEVEISRNDSPLYDETIAHRLGLIPIKTEKSVKDDTTTTLKLKTNKEGYVYSGELKGDSEIVFTNIPITALKAGQELQIKATTKLGIGKDHAKFNPGTLFYREVLEISADKSLKEKIEDKCSNEIKASGNKIVLIDDKEKEICDLCEGFSEKEDKDIEVKPTGELVVTIESFGQMPIKDVFNKATDVLKKDLNELAKKFK